MIELFTKEQRDLYFEKNCIFKKPGTCLKVGFCTNRNFYALIMSNNGWRISIESFRSSLTENQYKHFKPDILDLCNKNQTKNVFISLGLSFWVEWNNDDPAHRCTVVDYFFPEIKKALKKQFNRGNLLFLNEDSLHTEVLTIYKSKKLFDLNDPEVQALKSRALDRTNKRIAYYKELAKSND